MVEALEDVPSLTDLARLGGAWQTDGSRHNFALRLTEGDYQDGWSAASSPA